MDAVVEEKPSMIWIKDVPLIVEKVLGRPISMWTVRSWCRKGQLKSVKVQGRRYVLTSSLHKLLKGENHDSAQA